MGKGGEARTELGPTENLFSITGKSVFINYLYMRYWVRIQVVTGEFLQSFWASGGGWFERAISFG